MLRIPVELIVNAKRLQFLTLPLFARKQVFDVLVVLLRRPVAVTDGLLGVQTPLRVERFVPVTALG